MSVTPAERRAIDDKYWERNRSGLDLGDARGSYEDLDHGGVRRRYEHGRIYWHATTGAHEVHGGILQAYLDRGGPDRNPATDRRDLKFPTSDEHRTDDGRFPVSTFEEGAIYWLTGRGGVAVYGDFYDAYQRLGGGTGRLAYPVTDPIEVDEYDVQYFERGCLWRERDGDRLHAFYFQGMPTLGRPALLDRSEPASLELSSVLRCTVSVLDVQSGGARRDASVAGSGQALIDDDVPLPPPDDPGPIDEDDLPDDELPEGVPAELVESVRSAGQTLWSDRFDLVRVGTDPGDPIPLDVSVGPTKRTGTEIERATVTLHLEPADPDALEHQQLYDVVVRRGSRGPGGSADAFRILPHAVYVRDDWEDFAIAHATDLHVSERVDGFRQTLADHRRSSAQAFNNCNDRVREFIRYANRRHQDGDLDAVLATGDLIDYVFEETHHRAGPGNFAFLEEILLGRDRSADPKSPDPEELRVPIFTLLGNHDYIRNHYTLYFDVDIPSWPDRTIRKYSGFNLTPGGAKALQGGEKPTLSRDASVRMLDSDEFVNDYYATYLNPRLSYVVPLGNHRLVMLETGPNKDVLDSDRDALEHLFGLSNENERTFVNGSPNTDGIRDFDLRVLAKAVEDAGDDGRVIVGMHAPPMNPWVDEFPHYFRETERPAFDERRMERLVDSYFSRQFVVLPDPDDLVDLPDPANIDLPNEFPDWVREPTPHFKRGTVDDRFDGGVARDNLGQFLRLCAGVDVEGVPAPDRPVDLVLFGHVHRNVEYRTEWTGEAFRFFQDFYTETPERYYPDYDYFRYFGVTRTPDYLGDQRPIHIELDDGAASGGRPVEVHDEPARGYAPSRELAVPPYDDPLAATDDPAAWWDDHRPLFAQTACLGPIDHNQRRDPPNRPKRPSTAFQGFRELEVTDGELGRVEYVRLAGERFQATLRERLDDAPRDHHTGRANRGRSVGGEGPIEEPEPPDGPGPIVRDHRTESGGRGGTRTRRRSEDRADDVRRRRRRSRAERGRHRR